MSSYLAPSADIHETAIIGDGTSVWHLAQVREGAQIGLNCVIGRGAYVGPKVLIGDNVKIQNNALVYQPATIADGAFIGPSAVLTNDPHPRSVNPSGGRKSGTDWRPRAVVVGPGASIGAAAVCVAPVTIGGWAMVAAGAVVTHDVLDFALVMGVPARQRGWVGRTGIPLVSERAGRWRCPVSGEAYENVDGVLRGPLS